MSAEIPKAALKEWASAVKALESGDSILILRKGGISEETKHFEMMSDSFFLFPTFEHQKPELLKEPYRDYVAASQEAWRSEPETVPISSYAVAVQDVLVREEQDLQRAADFHIWTERLAEERLRWKRTQPLHAILLRVYLLPETVRIPVSDTYAGCKSWVELERTVPTDGAKPVLDDEEFERRRRQIVAALEG